MPEAERKSRVHNTAGRPSHASSPLPNNVYGFHGAISVDPKAKYILTFIDHFTKFVEAFTNHDQSPQTCARIYATHTVKRHSSNYKLVTDEGASFMFTFFSEKCKVLEGQMSRTSSYHQASNGTLQRWHKALYDGMSHYVNSSNWNWDLVLRFFFMAYRATHHSTTACSFFFLLHGREMVLPSNENLKGKVSRPYASYD
jgi:hypothetical protein